MRLINSDSIRRIDRLTMQDYQVPGLVLMENAGLEVVNAIEKEFPAHAGRALILCGGGNNGGDGLVIARHLKIRGWSVRVFLSSDPDNYTGDARINLDIAEKYGIRIDVCDPVDLTGLKACTQSADIIVDALLGTGASGPPYGTIEIMLLCLQDTIKPIISVDIPSGISADDGSIPGAAVRASITVTFGLPKPGMFLFPGAAHVGRLYIGEICLPPELLDKYSDKELLSTRNIQTVLPRRHKNSHKGQYGRVLVVGGSPGMSGAAALAGFGALRSGAGLVTIASPESLIPLISPVIPEATTIALPENEGVIDISAARMLIDSFSRFDSLVIGPGLSRNEQVISFVQSVLSGCPLPAVVDADALAALHGLKRASGTTTIITPHAGEMAKILNIERADVEVSRMKCAIKAADEFNCVAVLKGANTIIANPDGSAAINPTGNSGLAKGGSGDILAGITGSFLAQNLSAFNAAGAGCFVHGAAADMLANKCGTYGLLAREIADALPETIWRIIQGDTPGKMENAGQSRR